MRIVIHIKTLVLLLFLSKSICAASIFGTVTFKESTPMAGVIYTEGNFEPNSVVIDQVKRNFEKAVYVTHPGSKVTFMNTDNIRHNIFTRNISIDFKFNSGLLETGESVVKSVDWEVNSMTRIACFVHEGMEAYLVNIPTSKYEALDFTMPEFISKKRFKYSGRTPRSLRPLQSSVNFVLNDIDPSNSLYFMIPYKPILKLDLSGDKEQSFDINYGDGVIGSIDINLKQ
ncbi:MAG: hypothetical protein HWE24_02240 [Oceanospirillaceae bacterium]|nr:hypothetical protein [Oceanospirillaceae bacterium]